jgi:predicted protein tyrosine phosphatase
MFLRGAPSPNVEAIIAIHGQREFGVEAGVSHRLDLNFDDVDIPDTRDVIALQRAMSRRRYGEQNGLIETAPTSTDAAAIIEFAESLRGVEGILLCHCGAGISRAPAAALICLSVWRGVGTENECVAEILRLRRGAIPHAGLVSFADRLLSRNNRLVEAIAAAQRKDL